MIPTVMRAGSLLLALAMVLPLTALGARPAYACSCALSESTEEAFRSSDAVFAGEVVKIGELPMEREGTTTLMMPYLAPVTFDVKGAWKGVADDPVVVHGQGPGASCGLDFERGETYLVFAGGAGEGGGGMLQTGLCSATRQASVETARNMFGPPSTGLPETGGPTLSLLFWVPAACAALLALGTFLARQRP
ncbi:hypothetical protein GBA63_17060 [Rubrobacter tropicus]|uniref:Tissue inhibitor of metalloproteinase n=1 Tax=Rubrobacter tropicus TaxID=2653851 RepID=A0A6G8QCE0_9ACTN|nr:hypothetical protein [Rubrobacter tropicus]QIN84165.1 hypothetical protein GBA63_17060 [Rubrobacter tropicus]